MEVCLGRAHCRGEETAPQGAAVFREQATSPRRDLGDGLVRVTGDLLHDHAQALDGCNAAESGIQEGQGLRPKALVGDGLQKRDSLKPSNASSKHPGLFKCRL